MEKNLENKENKKEYLEKKDLDDFYKKYIY
jgi:hypothetical protein